MQTTLNANDTAALKPAVEQALERIPPLWPLTHFVAVNPYVGLTGRRFADACSIIQQATGGLPLQTPREYLDALHDGSLLIEDLRQVADEVWPVERLIRMLEEAESGHAAKVLPSFADFLDSQEEHAHWGVLIVEEISKWCAVAYDHNQTTWNSPWKAAGLFEGWREAAAHDRSPEANGLKGFRAFVSDLPYTAEETIAYCVKMIAQPEVATVDFLHRQLMTVSGWAGHIQYRVRELRMHGGQSEELRDLLAIRLAYDAALFAAFAAEGSVRSKWRRQRPVDTDAGLLEALVRWQSAYEIGYPRQLTGMLSVKHDSASLMQRPKAQAVFCIDVRSERIRRHLESCLPGVQTIGFAGFFGFPISHQKARSERLEARCPVLLTPPLHCPEPVTEGARHEALVHRKGKRAWKAFQNSAASCFSFVESFGIGFVAKLAGHGNDSHCCGDVRLPKLSELPLEQVAAMAEGALRNMSLTKGFARLILICGHGSHSTNNPYASALDCGACGGHAGDVNAKLAAAALNDPAVRQILKEKGLPIPDDTHFLAGLHDTLSDEVTLYQTAAVPASHRDELAELEQALAQAGRLTREERAPSLGLSQQDPATLDQAIKSRGNDMSQVRPEWGLANNAAIIVAPRSRTAGLNLKGRVFLHDYDAAADSELKVLNLILCAPVVVASWINLQYYASRIDPVNFGSGDKALHNVLGGIGVMEGNGGDLRGGLPLQSIHDGEKFVHEPRRLSVIIEAERTAISAVLAGQDAVRQLFDHGWIHLIALEGAQAYRYQEGEWLAM